MGYRVVLAASGAEALTILQGSRPDLILGDIRMPGMDGPALVTAVRSDPGFTGVKVVAVTGFSDGGEATRLLKAGFDGPLGQPSQLRYAARRSLDRFLWMPPKR